MKTKALNAVLLKGDSKGNRFRVRATSDGVDRQGERVIPSGVRNLDHFLKTGSILYAHDWSGLPIGKPLSAEVNDRELIIDIAFADTDLGNEMKYLYSNGYLSSFSIGFMPDFKQVDTIDGVRTYKAWDLLELSGTPVPANVDATILREAEARRGAPLAAIRKAMGGPDEDEDEEDEDLSEEDLNIDWDEDEDDELEFEKALEDEAQVQQGIRAKLADLKKTMRPVPCR